MAPEETILKVLIVEDMIDARDLLCHYSEAHPNLSVTAVARTGEEALNLIHHGSFDLVLLDINLPILSGIEVVERLDQLPYIIFTTAYDSYAMRAFEIGAIDYLLKPIDRERFDRAIDRALKFKEGEEKSSPAPARYGLTFREKRKSCIVPFDDIIYLSASAKHCIIHTEKKDFEASSMLKEIETKLPQESFQRIHKGYIVNIHHIRTIIHDRGSQYTLYINDSDDTSLPVGRTYLSRLKKKFHPHPEEE